MRAISRLALLLTFCLLVPSARAQFERGTIVVFIVSSDRIIVASDSRVLMPGQPPRDHACKIEALGNHFLFAQAGADLGGVSSGRSEQEAARAFSNFKTSAGARPTVEQVSAAWLRAMKPVFRRMLKAHRQDVLLQSPSGFLASAVFVGIDQMEHLKARSIDLYFYPVKLKKTGWSDLRVDDCPWAITSQLAHKTIGHSEVLKGFSNLPTESQYHAIRSWMMANPRRDEDSDLAFAEFLVDWSESNAPAEDGIGGPVDEVEILPKSGVQWIHRKPECPEDSAVPLR